MLEVSKVEFEGESFLRCQMKKLDPDIVSIITSIKGWWKGRDFLTYGLPFTAMDELNRRTRDYMVVWKLDNDDNMGALVKGIDTSDVSEDYCIPYEPKIPLRPHQIQAFNLLVQRDTMLVADQEGVGKTPPILCSHEAKIQHGLFKWGLFVTKASLTYDVYNQAKRFTNLKVMVIGGTQKQRIEKYEDLMEFRDYDLVVVSYELFRTDIAQFQMLDREIPFGVTYCDEMHKIKDLSTQVGKMVHEIKTTQRYAITATPVINEMIDMYNILVWLGVLNYNWFHFRNKFCELDGWGNVAKYKNIGELKAVLQANMLRRLKNQVLKDLPPVVPKTIYVDMTADQKKLYKAVQSNKTNWQEFDEYDLEFEDIPSDLARHARLTQIAESSEIVGGKEGVKGSAKLAELESLLADIVERGEKAVVFSRSKRFVHIMKKHFAKYNPAIMTGDISSQARKNQEVSDRQEQVDKFQEDETCKVIFCVEQASREGWTGTSGNNLIFTSKPWSPAYVSQAIGRIWRMGAQGHKSINVYTLIAQGTIDEKIELMLEDKQYTITTMVEQPMSTKQILAVLDNKEEVA